MKFFKGIQFLAVVALAIPVVACRHRHKKVKVTPQVAKVVNATSTGPATIPATTPTPAPSTTTMNATWSDEVLTAHNNARAKYGAEPLTWNGDLYDSALKWAQACNWGHSNGDYGENLYAGGDQSAAEVISDGVNMWMGEASDYDYNKPGFGEETGHFTQVVWKGTTSVSCAVNPCAAGTIYPNYIGMYLVCRYSPPGNYDGEFPQNVGKPVS